MLMCWKLLLSLYLLCWSHHFIALPPMNVVLCPLITSITQSSRPLPNSECPGFLCISTYLHFLRFLPQYLNSEYLICLSPCVYTHTHTGGSLSPFSLIWVVLPNLALQELVNCKFIISIIIGKLKTISEFVIVVELVLFLFFYYFF